MDQGSRVGCSKDSVGSKVENKNTLWVVESAVVSV